MINCPTKSKLKCQIKNLPIIFHIKKLILSNKDFLHCFGEKNLKDFLSGSLALSKQQ